MNNSRIFKYPRLTEALLKEIKELEKNAKNLMDTVFVIIGIY